MKRPLKPGENRQRNRERLNEQELRRYAAAIESQAKLEFLLKQVKREMLSQVYEQIKQHLTFRPAEDTLERVRGEAVSA